MTEVTDISREEFDRLKKQAYDYIMRNNKDNKTTNTLDLLIHLEVDAPIHLAIIRELEEEGKIHPVDDDDEEEEDS